MFAVTAVLKTGRIHLIGFANSPEEADRMTDEFIAYNGREKVEQLVARFNVELAI